MSRYIYIHIQAGGLGPLRGRENRKRCESWEGGATVAKGLSLSLSLSLCICVYVRVCELAWRGHRHVYRPDESCMVSILSEHHPAYCTDVDFNNYCSLKRRTQWVWQLCIYSKWGRWMLVCVGGRGAISAVCRELKLCLFTTTCQTCFGNPTPAPLSLDSAAQYCRPGIVFKSL